MSGSCGALDALMFCWRWYVLGVCSTSLLERLVCNCWQVWKKQDLLRGLILNKSAPERWIAHLNPCQEERMFTTKYKSHSPTLKSILGITQIITKAYQVNKFNQITFIWSAQFQCLTFLPDPIGQGCASCQTFCLHNVMCTINVLRFCFTFHPHTGVKGVQKGRTFACMVLYASF